MLVRLQPKINQAVPTPVHTSAYASANAAVATPPACACLKATAVAPQGVHSLAVHALLLRLKEFPC